ncbi:uncharacterized protein RHOBADRAFT_54812 [Rhodotorula graminis WP1]|uniref:HAD-superfamily subfamily IIA hydrolase n=1 Tax=Rhodotorula graminis (strain WP1) TaxID=578459 RepID=A0A0N8PZY4_RHOGW|nr:uncharacterized protein RHOBADRAFT_54812 [Rhodotorula graminis WP1]KPV73613.1 hypothetical protein RHOBADRAFT_54812 [Rhodotorula graminis WP1]
MPGLLPATRPWTRFAASASRSLSSAPKYPPAFAFDIDGVLKQGQNVLPQAKQALQILAGNNPLGKKYPFLCITNGGGTLESERAQRLTKELGVEIAEHQVVLSHTIFRSFVPEYKDKPVFVVGGRSDNCRRVAEAYGFKHVYVPADVQAWAPSIWPYGKLTDKQRAYVKTADFSKIQFAAILVFHDSLDAFRDLQLVCDLVRAQDGLFGTLKDPKDANAWRPERQIPVHFSNPDLLWGNEFAQARFGQGALQESIAAVYKRTTGHELQRTTGGKPTRATYDYAASLLHSAVFSPSSISLHPTGPAPALPFRVYMVGDNPQSDIAGANAYRSDIAGANAYQSDHADANADGWASILVQTGVFRGERPEDAEHVPTVVKRDVLEGVKWALEREGDGEAVSHIPSAHGEKTSDGPRE